MRAVAEHQVTLLQLVPSQLKMVLEVPGEHAASLRTLFCAERFSRQSWSRPFARGADDAAGQPVWATEATIDGSGARSPMARDRRRSPRAPVSNLRAYVLDGAMEPVPSASRANSIWPAKG